VRERGELFAMGKTPLKMNGIVTQKISLSNHLGALDAIELTRGMDLNRIKTSYPFPGRTSEGGAND
jgi:hypothetical protein